MKSQSVKTPGFRAIAAVALLALCGAWNADNVGGVRLLGGLGASIQLGIAMALLTGRPLSEPRQYGRP